MNPPVRGNDKLYQESLERERRRAEDAIAMKQAFKEAAEAWMVEHAEEQKKIFKAALSDWINDQFSMFGKFSMHTMIALCFAAVLWMYFSSKGFQKP